MSRKIFPIHSDFTAEVKKIKKTIKDISKLDADFVADTKKDLEGRLEAIAYESGQLITKEHIYYKGRHWGHSFCIYVDDSLLKELKENIDFSNYEGLTVAPCDPDNDRSRYFGYKGRTAIEMISDKSSVHALAGEINHCVMELKAKYRKMFS